MNQHQEQLMALAAVFEAAALVDRMARTGQIPQDALNCLLHSLLQRNPQNAAEVYGGNNHNLQEGYQALTSALMRDTQALKTPLLRYALSMITLERQLAKRKDMLTTISQRLQQIEHQVEHFEINHPNIIAAFGGLYQDTLSTFRQRIQIQGEMRYLQPTDNAATIRALLLAGIRSARLWRQLGGHRWQLIFSRSRMLKELRGS